MARRRTAADDVTGRALVVRGDARNLPLPDESVDLVCTSPPYFGLRSYTDAGQHYEGQVGSEATPAEFLEALWACTAEWVRVLKPSGSIWVNLGDKYGGFLANPSTKPGAIVAGRTQFKDANRDRRGRRGVIPGTTPKSLIGLPWRYAIGCIDQLGLILRAEVVWSKPNGLPESVTDRVRRSHEQWFHFTVSPRYFAAVDEIREPHAAKTLTHRGGGQAYGNDRNPDNHWGNPNGRARMPDPLGKLPGSVWTVPTEPLTVPDWLGVDHFAAYPLEWPLRIVAGWCPRGVCTECGQGRRPSVAQINERYDQLRAEVQAAGRTRANVGRGHKQGHAVTSAGAGSLISNGVRPEHVITGYVCACPSGRSGPQSATTPGIVLDPFGGTGTTALAAKALGRVGITVDLSHDYSRLAQWRTTDAGELAKAMRVEKPAPVIDGQGSIFDELGAL